MNIYLVNLQGNVDIDPAPHFGSKTTSSLYVLATSIDRVLAAVLRRFPGAAIRRIELINYTGTPIVLGD